jgi:DNA-binding MurR/RpiR family transcriptional regulator
MKPAAKQKSGLSIAESIRQGLGRLTPTERKPALVLLANYPVPGLEPVAQFAKRAGVSGPTVLIVANIEASLVEVPRSEFEGTLGLLADRSRRISLMGGRFSTSVALQFYLHLRELRPRVQLVTGQTATWVEHLLDFGRKDVLIVFDIRRYQDDVVRFAKEAAALGADIVLFTDQWLSPIASVARHVFALRTAIPSSWESFGAPSALTEILVARLQAMKWGESKKRMQRLEKIRSRLSAS